MKIRLKLLRKKYGLTQAKAGEIVLVNQSMYSRYENEQLDLSLEQAERFAYFYNVSIDYLVGITDNPTPYKKVKGRK